MVHPPIIVFDVNETLLDLDTIRPIFDRIFHDPAALRLWFDGLITYSEALTLAEVYVPFTDVGGAVLRMLASARDIAIRDKDSAELTERFASMPAHPEVPAALGRLRDHGFRLFTLTDNTLEISGRQLEKPASSTCSSAASASTRRSSATSRRRSRTTSWPGSSAPTRPTSAWWPVTWDTIGARSAGWQAGLILRPGNAPLDVGPQPNYVGDDLDAVADQLIDRMAA